MGNTDLHLCNSDISSQVKKIDIKCINLDPHETVIIMGRHRNNFREHSKSGNGMFEQFTWGKSIWEKPCMELSKNGEKKSKRLEETSYVRLYVQCQEFGLLARYGFNPSTWETET